MAGIADDSRRVRRGDLFIARAGVRQDGAVFARDALLAGAVAVVSDSPLTPDLAGRNILVDDVRVATGRLAHAFYSHPTRAVRVAAVTGTNGKTTTAYLVRHILRNLGIRCGLISTVEIDDGQKVFEADMTTPGAIELARQFASMREHGCTAAAIEASSHALDQGRLVDTTLAAAGFTNLTGDHLDYHGTMDDYAAAKAKLFAALPPGAAGVINAGDANAARMVRDSSGRIVRFCIDGKDDLDFQVTNIAAGSGLTTFDVVDRHGRRRAASIPMVGRHNVENAMVAALMVANGFDVPLDDVFTALSDAAGAPGRLQRVGNASKPSLNILVDYAHTDDALENVLRAVRPLTRGKLRVVFGCGGDRDPTKRPRMARVAKRLGDVVYVTSDNPRTEDPQKIIDDIVAGVPDGDRREMIVEPDRRRAIRRAIADATADDVVLIAGKGHEKYQIVGRERQHFDDVEEAAAAE